MLWLVDVGADEASCTYMQRMIRLGINAIWVCWIIRVDCTLQIDALSDFFPSRVLSARVQAGFQLELQREVLGHWFD